MCGESFQLIRATLHLTYLKSYLAHTFRHLCRSSVKRNLSITYQHKFGDLKIPLELFLFSSKCKPPGEQETVQRELAVRRSLNLGNSEHSKLKYNHVLFLL